MGLLHPHNGPILSSPTKLCRIHLKHYFSKCEADLKSGVHWFTSQGHGSLICYFLFFFFFLSFFSSSFFFLLPSLLFFSFPENFCRLKHSRSGTLNSSDFFIFISKSFCSSHTPMGNERPLPLLFSPKHFLCPQSKPQYVTSPRASPTPCPHDFVPADAGETGMLSAP